MYLIESGLSSISADFASAPPSASPLSLSLSLPPAPPALQRTPSSVSVSASVSVSIPGSEAVSPSVTPLLSPSSSFPALFPSSPSSPSSSSLSASSSSSSSSGWSLFVSSALSAVSACSSGFRLAFPSPELEEAYQSDYFARYFTPLRRIVLACVSIWILFVINDILQELDGKRRHFWVTVSMRFAVAALVGGTTLASYHHKVRAAIGPISLRWCVAGFILLFGTCQVAFGVIEENTQEPTYCDFIILLAAMSGSLFRLPFFLSTACNVLMFLVFVVLTVGSSAWPDGEPESFISAMVWLVVALLLFTVNGYLVERSMRSTFNAAQQLAEEEANSQRVLVTMLPVRVIAELRGAKSAFVYEYHRSMSVLFSHIHQFDQHTASLQAGEVVELLNALFSRFDHLTDCFGVYKVETIGDVYLVSGGVPDELGPHASICALLALAMMDETSRLLASRRLQLRIGVHSGDVIAGVVGLKYPRYRLMVRHRHSHTDAHARCTFHSTAHRPFRRSSCYVVCGVVCVVRVCVVRVCVASLNTVL